MFLKVPIYHIDAFTDDLFAGNPAAVCVLEDHLSDDLLQSIAEENNLPATAFLTHKENAFAIRWFGPNYEIPLCGHGTLASTFVIFEVLKYEHPFANLIYPTGSLRANKQEELYVFEFPKKNIEEISLDTLFVNALGAKPDQVFKHASESILAVFDDEAQIAQLTPEMELLSKLGFKRVIVTAPGRRVDFVSRTFYPHKLIKEDSVTGSSHCLLVPYWSDRLNNKHLKAHQSSKRGGSIQCKLQDEHILIMGNAVLFMEGHIII